MRSRFIATMKSESRCFASSTELGKSAWGIDIFARLFFTILSSHPISHQESSSEMDGTQPVGWKISKSCFDCLDVQPPKSRSCFIASALPRAWFNIASISRNVFNTLHKARDSSEQQDSFPDFTSCV